MNWIEMAWIAMSAASLTTGVIHLFVWVKHKSQRAHLLSFALAATATAFDVFESTMMQAPSATAYAATLRWGHVPVISECFCRPHAQRTCRGWRCWASCPARWRPS